MPVREYPQTGNNNNDDWCFLHASSSAHTLCWHNVLVETTCISLTLCTGRRNCGVAYTSNFDLAAHVKTKHDDSAAASSSSRCVARVLARARSDAESIAHLLSLVKRVSVRPSKHRAVEYVSLDDDSGDDEEDKQRRRGVVKKTGDLAATPSPRPAALRKSEGGDMAPELGSISPAQSESDVIVPKAGPQVCCCALQLNGTQSSDDHTPQASLSAHCASCNVRMYKGLDYTCAQ